MPFRKLTERTISGYETLRAGTSAMADFLRRVMPDNFNIRQLGPEGLMTMKREIVAARPIFVEAGFSLAAVELEMTLSPRLLAYFHVLDHFDRDTARAVHDANNENSAIAATLPGLMRIADWDPIRQEQDMPLQTITIDVSLTPGVHLSFQDNPPKGQDPDIF